MTDPTVPDPIPPAPTLKPPAKLTMREQVEACREAARLLESVRESRFYCMTLERGFIEGKVEAILDEAIGQAHKAMVWVDDRPSHEQDEDLRQVEGRA